MTFFTLSESVLHKTNHHLWGSVNGFIQLFAPRFFQKLKLSLISEFYIYSLEKPSKNQQTTITTTPSPPTQSSFPSNPKKSQTKPSIQVTKQGKNTLFVCSFPVFWISLSAKYEILLLNEYIILWCVFNEVGWIKFKEMIEIITWLVISEFISMSFVCWPRYRVKLKVEIFNLVRKLFQNLHVTADLLK